jgi:hypothetical protein
MEARLLERKKMRPVQLGRVVGEILDLGDKAAAEKVLHRERGAVQGGAHVEDHVGDDRSRAPARFFE